jgi:hypothetical protein
VVHAWPTACFQQWWKSNSHSRRCTSRASSSQEARPARQAAHRSTKANGSQANAASTARYVRTFTATIALL